MTRILKSIDYLWALFVANMKSYGPEKKRLFVMSFFMMVQNSLFFILWVIFFQHVSQLRGWHLEDVARMYGIVGTSAGLSMFLFNGMRSLPYRIQDGTLDGFITRPRSVLPALIMSSSSSASLGDICFGPLIWAVLGNISFADVPLLLLVTTLSTAVFTSSMILIYSIAFWLKGNTRLPDQLFEVLIISSAVVQHGQPFFVRLVIMTLIPAWFITYLPTQLVRSFDPFSFAVLGVAVVFYASLSIVVFKAGLKRYINSLT